MPLPVIADVARVAFKGSWDGGVSHTVNVLHVKRLSSSDPWTGIVNRINAALTHVDSSEMFAVTAGGWTLDEFDLTPLDGTTGTITKSRGTEAWPTANGGSGPMPQVAAIVKLTTAKRGKSYRGRVFLGPVAEQSYADGEIDHTGAGEVTASWVNFANELVSHDPSSALVIASYKLRTAEQVTNLACEFRSATQRRRNHR